MVYGVPHPSGYPLYMLILRGWLWLGQLIDPHFEIAYWGNRLSGSCVAGAVAFTVVTTASLLRPLALRWVWASWAGFAFALTPLAWSQALITEVYGLHTLLIAAMGWAVLTQRIPTSGPNIGVGVLMGLGAAHHLTSLWLWPALLYWSLHAHPRQAWLGMSARLIGIALIVALPFYAGLVWRVASSTAPPPIAWGYPRDLSGLWWLVSGVAYRGYLFGMSPIEYGGRLAALARLLVEQFTPGGLALVIGGFAVWDRQRHFLRNGALLWTVPVSLYAAGYNTVDSYIYLLPVAWLMALMLGQGLASSHVWLAERSGNAARWLPGLVATLALIAIVALTAWRLPQLDLRHDHEAQDFLNAAATTLEPGSLVISSADAQTFALWYGQWADGTAGAGDTLAQAVPDLIFVNHALYQFGWYRNLMHDVYPEVPKLGATFAELIEANRSLRPIYTTEPLPELPPAELIPAGFFWRLHTP
jgi:hypothetical protein